MNQRPQTIQYIRNQNHRGSSLITVLVVITVLMVIVLSVLAVSYQYYMTQVNDMYEEKCEETAYSLARELRGEIAGKKYDTYQLQENSKNELWTYLRGTIAQSQSTDNAWPYYDDAQERSVLDSENFQYDIETWRKADSLADAKRYFKLQPTNSGDSLLNEELPATSVCMYWTPGKYTNSVSGLRLHVIVTCQMGDYSYTIRDIYSLSVDAYTGSETDYVTMVHCNDTNTEIYKFQEWKWDYEGEE